MANHRWTQFLVFSLLTLLALNSYAEDQKQAGNNPGATNAPAASSEIRVRVSDSAKPPCEGCAQINGLIPIKVIAPAVKQAVKLLKPGDGIRAEVFSAKGKDGDEYELIDAGYRGLEARDQPDGTIAFS